MVTMWPAVRLVGYVVVARVTSPVVAVAQRWGRIAQAITTDDNPNDSSGDRKRSIEKNYLVTGYG